MQYERGLSNLPILVIIIFASLSIQIYECCQIITIGPNYFYALQGVALEALSLESEDQLA